MCFQCHRTSFLLVLNVRTEEEKERREEAGLLHGGDVGPEGAQRHEDMIISGIDYLM